MSIKITETKESFNTWLEKDFVNEQLRNELSGVSILIVPFEKLRDSANPLMFPIGTSEILQYFKSNLPSEYSIDICITDELYQEFAFFSDSKRLGNFIIMTITIPLFIGIISSYIANNITKGNEKKPQINIVDNSKQTTIINLTDKKFLEPPNIEFSVTVVDSVGNSKNISYEGPASDIDEVFKALKEYEEH
ncbi:MAG: hypothetical protein JXR53_15520 [Bacteroidales bacterium]|nr:hypothetical protein [Bacteroidales bacterium]